jgi:hypothetical protein
LSNEYLNGVGQGGVSPLPCLNSSVNFFLGDCLIETTTIN